jgi:serine/threonine protein phosphatase PrpC
MIMPDAELHLAGVACRSYWPQGPGCYTEDDFRIDPALGAAVVALGLGAIGAQGSPVSKLAVWSVVGQLAAASAQPAEQRLRGAFARADVAVARFNLEWPPALLGPVADLAALLLDGNQAFIGHLGGCRISRITAGGVVPLTEEHTVRREIRESGGDPDAVPPEMAGIVTKALGVIGRQHEIRRIEVRAGDRFLIATRALHKLLGERDLHACAAPGTQAPHELSTMRDLLLARAKDRAPERGGVTFALVEIRPGRARTAAVGGSAEPVPSWLYHPGAELPELPPELGNGPPKGPDDRWFQETWKLVMGSDRPWGGSIVC